MAKRIARVVPTSLVRDFDLYPREMVDSTHVRHIMDAIEAGVKVPPLIVDRKSKRIIDGFHRHSAHLRIDKTKPVDVEYRDYDSDSAMFAEAMALNANHGRKLSTNDRVRCVLRARELGIDDELTAVSLNTTVTTVERYVQELTVKVVGQTTGRKVLKMPVRHLVGSKITAKQAEAIDRLGGNKQVFFVNQLIRLIEADLLDRGDEKLMERLAKLVELAAPLAQCV